VSEYEHIANDVSVLVSAIVFGTTFTTQTSNPVQKLKCVNFGDRSDSVSAEIAGCGRKSITVFCLRSTDVEPETAVHVFIAFVYLRRNLTYAVLQLIYEYSP